MRSRPHSPGSLATVGLVLLAAACGGAANAPSAGESPTNPGEPHTVTCGASEYEPGTLADAPGIATLPDGPSGATDDAGAAAFDPSQDWRVVHQSDDRVELVRELEEPVERGEGDVATHESRVLERITGAPNVPEGAWLLTSAGPCAQRIPMPDGLATADLSLAGELSPDATSIDLLVHERACASGRSAEGRVELLELDESGEQVMLRIGVRALEGGQDCQGNPSTPFTVELTAPLGERAILDASVVPARPLTG